MTARRDVLVARVLLDTNVVSEVRRPVPDPAVIRYLRGLDPEETFLSTVVVGELAYGVARLASRRRRDELRTWLDGLKRTYARQILPLDTEAAEIWGSVSAACEAKGKTLPVRDAQIAAIARRHDLTLATRNTADFVATGIPLIDPWREG